MSIFPARRRQAPVGLTRTPVQVVEWGALVALFSDVVACCDCHTCQEAEALATARRLRALAEEDPLASTA